MDERAPRTRRTIDRPADDVIADEAVDLARILRGVAVRLDAILDDGGRQPNRIGTPTAGDPVKAWSSVVSDGAQTADNEARRAALATTVLRMGPDGSMDVLEEQPYAPDDDGPARDVESDPAASAADADGDRGEASQERDVERRIRSARERLERRRAAVTVEEGDVRATVWRRLPVRHLMRRLLVAAAIVGASAAVAVLLT